MTKLKILEKLSPCEIEYTFTDYGRYTFDYSDENMEINLIKIDLTLKEHEKLAILAHEMGHALCDKNKCKCFSEIRKNMNGVSSLAEYHAHKFALKWLLDNGCKRALRYYIKTIRKLSKPPIIEAYIKAAKRIMKLKLWQKCLDFVGE
jgi:Zn-dependent peptidase ImmA (M78 family)